MRQSLQLRTSQQLAMTPQLQQAIRMLQLSTLELQIEIQQALDSNMMLEEESADEFSEESDHQSPSEAQGDTDTDINVTEEIPASAEQELTTESGMNEKTADIPDELPVDSSWDDIYDVASITKIVATLPALMKLTQDGRFSVDDKLAKYLPDLDTCDKGELLIKDILTHQAGLVPWIPFYYSTIEPMDIDQDLISKKLSSNYPFRLAGHIFLNKNLKFTDGAYADEYSSQYPYQVAEGLYMNRIYRDSIMHRIINSKLRDKKEYMYSDLGYYFLKPITENLIGMPLELYTRENLYKPLGASLTGFLPLEQFPAERIAPTENDLHFRRQLLRGFVHDPGAAMLGGVAGHAGIFSNANDLAKIMQMYLNGGHYGGMEFIADTIIDQFNTCIHCEDGNRRGIGFDKPEMDYEEEGPTCQCVSPDSFGHSGFTGTLVWADPDTGILYVFLSNKIHPDQDNPRLVEMDVRTNIQQVLHDALMY